MQKSPDEKFVWSMSHMFIHVISEPIRQAETTPSVSEACVEAW